MKNKLKLFLIFAFFCTAIIAILKLNYNGIVFGINKSKVISKVEKNIEDSQQDKFYTYGKNIYRLTKTGVELLDYNGELVWKDEFFMNAPRLIHDYGNFIAVAERNGQDLFVYNEKGRVYSVTLESPILTASINNNGYTSLLCSIETNYKLYIYDSNGEIVFTGNFVNDGREYPIATAISNDNKILAVTFLETSGVDIASDILFYYLGNDEEYLNIGIDRDRVFGGVLRPGVVAGLIRFNKDDDFIIVSESDISLIKIKGQNKSDTYEEKWKIEFKNIAKDISFSEDGYIAVAFGEAMLNTLEEHTSNTVKIYNKHGQKTNEYIAEKDITGVYSAYDATIVEMGRYFVCLKNSGGVLWSINKLQDVIDIKLIDNSKRVMFVYDKKFEITNVLKKNNPEEQTTEIQSDSNDEDELTETTTEELISDTSQKIDGQENLQSQIEDSSSEPTTVEKKSLGARFDEKINQILDFIRGDRESSSDGFVQEEISNSGNIPEEIQIPSE